MDIIKLVVGQEVQMSCGHYVCKGEVVEVSSESVVVQHTYSKECDSDPYLRQWNPGELLRFDNNGKGWYITETSDCPGPWYLEGALAEKDIKSRFL